MLLTFIKQKITSNWILIVCLLALAVIFYIWYSQPTMAEKAYLSCQDSVKQQLQVPTGAVFPAFNKVVSQRINTDLSIKGYVDSPDASGSLQRSYYTCVFEIVHDYETRLVSTKLY